MSEPCACCSAPRAVRIITLSASPRRRARSRSSSAGTPVTRSTRSGHHDATESLTGCEAGGARGDVLLVDVAARDHQVQQGLAPARGRCRAPAARRRRPCRRSRCDAGRSRTTLPPRSRRLTRWRAAGGMVSARLEPTRTSTSVCSRSASGNGRPRSSAERAGAGRRRRRHAPAAVVVDLRGPERDAGELAELVGLLVGQPAATEDPDAVGTVRRTQLGRARRRRGRAPRPSSAGRNSPVAASRTSGVVSRSRWRSRLGGGPALAAHRRPG